MFDNFNGWKITECISGGLGQWVCILGGLWFTIGAIADKNSFWVAAACYSAYPILVCLNVIAMFCAASRDAEILKQKEN